MDDNKFSVGSIYGNLEIIELIYSTRKGKKINLIKGAKCKCVKCGSIEEKYKYRITGDKIGCSVCSSKKVIRGINDIATTHPHMVKYFVNIEDVYTYMMRSHKKMQMKCIDCSFEKLMSPDALFTNGFCCPKCGRGESFPNRMMYCFFNQLLENSDFEREKSFVWSKGKRYDFYIPSLKCIIEAHGGQHYNADFHSYFGGKTLQEEQSNDEYKKQMALSNGIKHYIVLDCSRSNFNWIKNSILKSKLSELLNINCNKNINWDKIAEDTSRNTTKEISNFWKNNCNNYEDTPTDLVKHFKMTSASIREHLKLGASLGWCDYDPKITQNTGQKRNARKGVV